MNPTAKNMTERKLLLIFCAIYFGLSLFAMVHFLQVGGMGFRGHWQHRFEHMYGGDAGVPFAYRILVPTITKGIVAITPQPVHHAIDRSVKQFAHQPQIARVFSGLPKSFPKRYDAYPRFVVLLMVYSALLAYAAMLYKLADRVFPNDPAIRYFAPIFAMGSLQAFSYPMQFFYDFPLLFFVTVGYYAFYTKNFKLYAVCLPLACLNKETAVFLILFFAAWFYDKMDRKAYIKMLTWQVLFYIGLRMVLAIAYNDNPHWFDTHKYFAPFIKDLMHRSSIDRLVNLVVLFFLLTYRWVEKPAFLKTVLWLLPVMFGAYLIFGYPREYRVFFDLMPLLVLLGTHTLVAGTGISQSLIFTRLKQENVP